MMTRTINFGRTAHRMRKIFGTWTFLACMLFLGSGGCATTEEISPNSDGQGLSFDYAKKKTDWPITLPDDESNLSVAHEATPEEHVQQGDRFRRQGKLFLALTYYEKALAVEPGLFEVRMKIGSILLHSKQPLKAKPHFVKVLEEHTDFAPAFEGLGQVFFQLERFEESERHLLQALTLDSDLWKSHALLGIIFDLRGDHMEAIAEHSLAIALHPEVGQLYNNLGVSYSLAGNNRQASIAFQKALKKGVSDHQVYNNLGLTLTRMGDYHRALDVLSSQGQEAQAYNNLGVLMLKDGYSRQAIACFEQALEAQPTFYPKARQNLKRARHVLRQQVQAGIPPSEGIPSPCNSIS